MAEENGRSRCKEIGEEHSRSGERAYVDAKSRLFPAAIVE